MKNLFVYIFLFSISHCFAQKTEVTFDSKNKLILKWNTKERLSNGIGSLQGNTSISVKHREVNDVTLLWVLLNHETINSSDFAGIFFDDAPGYKQGVALWKPVQRCLEMMYNFITGNIQMAYTVLP